MNHVTLEEAFGLTKPLFLEKYMAVIHTYETTQTFLGIDYPLMVSYTFAKGYSATKVDEGMRDAVQIQSVAAKGFLPDWVKDPWATVKIDDKWDETLTDEILNSLL